MTLHEGVLVGQLLELRGGHQPRVVEQQGRGMCPKRPLVENARVAGAAENAQWPVTGACKPTTLIRAPRSQPCASCRRSGP